MIIRKKLIADYCDGKLKGKSYAEIENIYKIDKAGKPGDRVRSWIKWYESKGKHIGKYSPDTKETVVSSSVDSEKPSKSPLLLKKKWQAQTKEGVIWLESYENKIDPAAIKAFRDEIINSVPSKKAAFTPKAEHKYGKLLVISIPDYHLGRSEVNPYDCIFVLEELLVKVSHHVIDHIVFVIGNDYFNTDFDYKTTKGTQQFDWLEWKETWLLGRDILVSCIDLIKNKKCPITIINVPGNHDSHRAFFLGDYVKGYYRNDDQITVDNSDNLVKVFKYNDVLLAFEHGEFRQSEYESILANEYPEQWGTTKYREFLCGHLHAETVKEFRGLKLRHLPSLANESEWERKQGYKHHKEAQALIYSKDSLDAIYIGKAN